MVCLIKSQYKTELKHYASILGSEEAAYYVLAVNNGYTLDKNPDGSASTLWGALLQANGGDEAAAILSKSVVYTPLYTDKYSIWYEDFDIANGSVEPSITTLNNDQQLCDNSAIKQILNDPVATTQRLVSAEQQNQLDRDVVIQGALMEECEQYVNDNFADRRQNTPASVSDHDVQAGLKREYYSQRLERTVTSLISQLRETFGRAVWLDPRTGRYAGADEFSNVQANILNTLQDRLSNTTDYVSSTTASRTTKTGQTKQGRELEFTIVTLLRQELLGIPAESQLRTVIESYLRTFSNSEPMQEAFSILKDKFKNRSTDAMISEIANYISGDVQQTSLHRERNREIESFWQKFKNFIRKIIPGLKQKDYNQRRNVLDTITAYFATNQQLDDVDYEDLLYDINMWRTGNVDITPQAVISQIKRSIESRIKSLKSVIREQVDEQELLTLQDWLADIDALSRVPKDQLTEEQYQLIDKFFVNGLQEIQGAVRTLISMVNIDESGINASDLMRIKTDVVGFYESIINQYALPMLRRVNAQQYPQQVQAIKSSIKIITNALSVVKESFDTQLERYLDYKIDKFVDEYGQTGDTERLRVNMKLHLRNKINNGELAFLDKYFSSGISSQSPIVRMLDVHLREARLAAHKSALRIQKLRQLYLDAAGTLNNFSFKNFLREFCEKDNDGRLTGNFVAEVNRGLFQKRLNEGLKGLYTKHHAYLNDEGQWSFPSDADMKAFLDDRDQLIEGLGGHRRYTAAYYQTRRQFLSQGTIEVQQQLRRDIDRILKKCTETIEVNGKQVKVVVEANLTSEDASKLQELRKQQENLGNLYDMTFDPVTGKLLSVKEKTGVALQMAKEIIAWNKYKANYLKYTTNNKAYQEALQALIQKYGANSRQVKLFEWRNSNTHLTPEYYEQLSKAIGGGSSSQKRAELLAKRKAILDACRVKKGYYEPNLDLLSEDMFAELKRIDEELSKNKATGGVFDKAAYEALVGQNQVKKQGQTTSYFDWLRQQYETRAATDPNAMNEFYSKYMYVQKTKNGTKVVPLSCFSYNGPIDAKYKETGATGLYMDLDESSVYIDPEYDTEDDDFIQVDKKMYHNPQYDKIMSNPKMKAFYDELMSIMDEIWSLLPKTSKQYRYQMPQRRAKSSRLLFRKDFLSNAKSMIQQAFSITERDTEYNEEFTRRPDGSVVETVPLRYLNKLEDPNTIDTNIIGSVAAMLEMATSFNQKQSFLPIMEALNFKLYGGFAGLGQASSDQADRFKAHMSMYMYGRMRGGFRKGKKLSPTERLLQKMTQGINTTVWNKLMIHNWNSVLKNAIDSFWSLLAEASDGRYFSMQDIRNAQIHCFGRELSSGGAVGEIGSIKANSMTAALMQYNRVSGNIDSIFDGAELSRVRRTLSGTKTGEYTAVDYLFKGVVTEAIYSSFRLITNPVTGKQEFLNRQQVQFAYVKAGATEKDGNRAYESANVSLRDAYTKDEYGLIQVKPEYLDIVCPIIDVQSGVRSKKLETRVSNIINERCAVINGMLDEMDRNVISQNYIGATFLLMRGWLLSQQIDYNKTGHDFATYANEDDAAVMPQSSSFQKIKAAILDSGATQVVQEDERYAGQMNFSTGNIDKGAWTGLLKAYTAWVKSGMYLRHFASQNKMTLQQQAAVQRMNTCIISVMLLSLATFVFGALREDNPDDWVFAYLYNAAVSTISERASQLGHAALVFVLSDLIQTPAVATAFINDLGFVPQALFDLMSMAYNWATDGDDEIDAYKEINRGTYKGLKKYQRDLLKASSEIPDLNEIGIDNLYKDTSMPAIDSRGEWFAQIAPTPWLAYVPRYGENKKPQKGIWGALLNEETSNSNTSNTSVWQSFKNTIKGQDYAGESGTTSRQKSKQKKSGGSPW